jgi:glycerol uptake facilitator protein
MVDDASAGVIGDPGLLEEEVPVQAPLLRRVAAEFIGTALLVAVGAGTATTLALGPLRRLDSLGEVFGTSPTAQANNKVFGTLLGTAGASLGDVLGVAIAFALILAVLVYALGGVSGAHFNPAVTFALACVRRFKWSEIPAYWLAQCAGGVGGAFLIAMMYGGDGAQFKGTDILFGATVYHQSTTNFFQGLAAEALITFILVTAIMAVAIDPRAPKGWSGLIIGFALGAGVLIAGPATGGSANFARSLGPFVASLRYHAGSIPWHDLYLYAAGPIVGAVAAAFVYESVTGMELAGPAPQPGSATTDTVLDASEEEILPPPDTTGI